MRAYHGDHYTAPNMVVAAAGNVSHERVWSSSEELLGNLSPASGEGVYEPAAPGAPTLVVKEKATEQYHLALGGPGLSRNDPRRHAQSVLDTVLGGSMSSRLFQEVREKRGLAYSVGSYVVGYADAGQVGVYLGTREDNLATACEIIGTELRRIGGEPLPADELQRAKDHLKGRLVLGMESSGTRMNRIGRSVLTGTELLTIDEIVARIDAVTAEDVARPGPRPLAAGDDVGGGHRPRRRRHPRRHRRALPGARGGLRGSACCLAGRGERGWRAWEGWSHSSPLTRSR